MRRSSNETLLKKSDLRVNMYKDLLRFIKDNTSETTSSEFFEISVIKTVTIV